MNKLITTTLMSIGIAAATASLAVAQTQNAPAGHPPQMMHHHHEPALKPGERVEARLAYIKTALKITDGQQAQWNAFADMERSQAAQREQRMREFHAGMQQHDHQRPNSIQRLEFMQQRLAAGVTGINERLVAERPLYAALSPEQKKVADEVLAPHRHGHHGFGHGDMHSKA